MEEEEGPEAPAGRPKAEEAPVAVPPKAEVVVEGTAVELGVEEEKAPKPPEVAPPKADVGATADAPNAEGAPNPEDAEGVAVDPEPNAEPVTGAVGAPKAEVVDEGVAPKAEVEGALDCPKAEVVGVAPNALGREPTAEAPKAEGAPKAELGAEGPPKAEGVVD